MDSLTDTYAPKKLLTGADLKANGERLGAEQGGEITAALLE